MADQFGFETPTEVQARLMEAFRARREKMEQQAQGPGQELGIALGQIFGAFRPPRPKDPYGEVDRAKVIADAQKGVSGSMQAMVANGMDVSRARAVAMFDVAERLQKAGLYTEADKLRAAGAESLEAARTAELERSNIKSQINTRQSQERREQAEFNAEGDNFYLPRESKMVWIPTSDLPARQAARAAGGFEFTPGAFSTTVEASDVGITPKTQSTIEERIFNAGESLARIDSIMDGYDPQFQTFMGQAKAAGINLLDKITPDMVDKSPWMADYVDRFNDFRTATVQNMNLYIKEITGAQMSYQEADRLLKGIPNPDDGPRRFITKARYIQRMLHAAAARAAYYRKKGFDTLPFLDSEGNEDTENPLYRPVEDFAPPEAAAAPEKPAPAAPATTQGAMSDDDFEARKKALGLN